MQRPHCEEHAQVSAVARCAGCGKYLCRDCLVEMAARPWCRDCAARAAGERSGRTAGAPDGAGESAKAGFTISPGERTTPGPPPQAPPPAPEEREARVPEAYAPHGALIQPPSAPPSQPPRTTPGPPPQAPPPAPEEREAQGPQGLPPRGAQPRPPSYSPAGAGPGGGPVAAKVVATCAYHPGVRAVTRCARCGALICAGCRRTAGSKSYCEPCFTAAGAGTATGTGGVFPGRAPAPAGVAWKLWPGLAFLPVPFLLNGLMTYMMRQGDEISVGAAQLLVSLLLYSSTLAFAFLVAYRYGSPLEEIGMSARNLPRSLGLGLVGGSLSFWLAVAGGLMSTGMFRGLENVERWLQGFFDVNVKSLTGADVFIAGIIIIVAAPICEEIFFRGYLYPAMRNHLGLWGAAFLNGFLFSVVHFSVFGLIGRTLAGVIFCLLYEYNDNLWSPIAAHALNNFVAFFLPLVVIWGS